MTASDVGEKCALCRHVTAGHTAILDLDARVGIVVVPNPARNWVVSTEIRTTAVGGLAFETVVEHCRYDEGSRAMATWLDAMGWGYAPNESAAGLPLEAGCTDDGSVVYLLVPQRSAAHDEPVV